MPAFDMIVAAANNGVIGHNGDMPWHVPEDLKHFKKTTQGHPVLMGRKTWESLPFKPLPKRLNLIMSRELVLDDVSGAAVVESIDDARQSLQRLVPEADTCFIMGGATLYDVFYEEARYVWLTRLDIAPEGDTYFTLPETRDFVLEFKEAPQISVSGVRFQIEKWHNPKA